MTVFKTFLKILNKNKSIVILYSVILVIFGGINMSNNAQEMTSFTETKPSIVIINNSDSILTKNIEKYFAKKGEIKTFDNENDLKDALFYRTVSYIIEIPEHYTEDYLNKKDPVINIKASSDYRSSLADILLRKYLKVSNAYLEITQDQNEIVKGINETLKFDTEVVVTSSVDTSSTTKMTYYYNFMNYSILAGVIFIICIIMCSFNNENVKKRIIISSIDYKKHNFILLLSNTLFAFVLWFIYVILSYFLCGSEVLSLRGLCYMANSLVFTFTAVTIAFFISNLTNTKESISGIVNVVALGSCFLCGAFVPVEFLPSQVLSFAHVLPSYYYINSNEILKTIEQINLETLKPILCNMLIMVLFAVAFIILSNIISKKKRKIA